jgi:molybdopterin/thiamine biosynthesis adenylyltransferase
LLRELASHNEDLGRLLERKLALKLDSSYLVVRDLPYLDQAGQLKIGALVTKLVFVDNLRIGPQENHQVFFAGSLPHNIDGTPIPNLGSQIATLALGDPSIVVERQFSNKPSEGFSNLFDKIESYVTLISGPAQTRDGITPYTGRVDEGELHESVFKFHDTLTSRAEIGDLAQRFKDEVVMIVGLGGTGTYVLDLLAKTPVKEIRGFDHDVFYVHNAFRSPGRLEASELGFKKAAVCRGRYENFRTGVVIEPRFIDASSEAEVRGVTFAFVCVDKGSSRAGIFELLLANQIPFIDVGMGIDRKPGPLSGMVRMTYYPRENGAAIRDARLAEMVDDPNDIYRTNVQLAELNALNAAVAVIKYKQIRGFYHNDRSWDHLLFGIDDLHVVGEPW